MLHLATTKTYLLFGESRYFGGAAGRGRFSTVLSPLTVCFPGGLSRQVVEAFDDVVGLKSPRLSLGRLRGPKSSKGPNGYFRGLRRTAGQQAQRQAAEAKR